MHVTYGVLTGSYKNSTLYSISVCRLTEFRKIADLMQATHPVNNRRKFCSKILNRFYEIAT